MDFRRNGLRDERRRRVLIDETLHGNSAEAGTSGAAADTKEAARTPVKSYSDAAIASSLLPVSTFLPKHPFITWSVWFAGGLVIAGIELLYHYAYVLAPEPLRPSLSALDVNGRGSLAGWFGGLVLGVAAFGSLLIYQIRRHRTNDYRGRYRWWLWLVPLLLVLSVNAATGLHEVLSGVLTAVTGASIAVQGKGWWMLAYAAVFFPIVLQLVIEVWPSRLASFFLVLTTSAYLTAGMFELQAVRLPMPDAIPYCHTAVLLAAHLGVLVTVLAYGRYVYLDAHERLAPRRRWVRWPAWKGTGGASAPRKGTRSRGNKSTRVDEAHARFGQDQSLPPTVTLEASGGPEVEEEEGTHAVGRGEEEGDENRKLSRSERRRLRKDSQRLQRG